MTIKALQPWNSSSCFIAVKQGMNIVLSMILSYLEMQLWERTGKEESLILLLFIVLKQKKMFIVTTLKAISITDF